MQQLVEIKRSETLQATPGNFGTEVHDGALYISGCVFDLLRDCHLRSAGEVFAVLHAFPSITDTLQWSTEDMGKAVDALRTQLRGLVDDVLLDCDVTKLPQFRMNAVHPVDDVFGKTAYEITGESKGTVCGGKKGLNAGGELAAQFDVFMWSDTVAD